MTELIVASTGEPSTVYGVHGAAGTSYWKCFARGNVLASALEAWEYAALSAGAVNGEHLHTRTDEVYFILAGAGRMTLDSEPVDVAPGDAVLTPLGARHGLSNTSADLLEWLTIEVTAPCTTRILAGETTAEGEPMATDSAIGAQRATVVNLNDGEPLIPTAYLSDRWRALQIVSLASGEEHHLLAGQVEHATYILAGAGVARTSESEIPLEPGIALTLPRGSTATFVGGEHSLRFFHVALETAF